MAYFMSDEFDTNVAAFNTHAFGFVASAKSMMLIVCRGSLRLQSHSWACK